jgi:4-hydroxybenzoate polyprenyltransferase
VLPNTAFGLFGAFSGELHTTRTPISICDILLRAPSVLIFNWSNLLIFDLSNQRSPESAEEDRINKPWRPIPQKMITCEQTRRLTIACIPLVFVINLALGVSNETAILYTLTWLYNDLRGGDELFIRDGIISVAFGVYNTGSLRLAIGSDEVITKQGYIWIAMISGVILTTMNIQDLRDEAGDSVRGRVTVSLALGSTMARKLLVFFITLCSLICSLFWGQSFWIFLLPLSLGLFIAHRLIYLSGCGEDTRTWKFWCLWCVNLYLLPCISKM